MRRTCAYFISFLILAVPCLVKGQDSLLFPLNIKAGIEISGPVIYLTDENNLSVEGFVSYDRNEKMTFVLEGGYVKYKYSQYNYDYRTKGSFARAGVDFNLLKSDISKGKYWAGLGLRYGVSTFNSETPSFQHENYWGTTTSSIPSRTSWGHFVEVAPGIKTEVFKNLSFGWTIRLRLLISAGTGKDLRPIYFPGFGRGGKSTSAGISYFMILNIPYKTISVKIKEEVQVTEEPEETIR
jgi:hypothetical protein